jgi:hypothetical protein
VVVDPADGGKIVSIVGGSREWLEPSTARSGIGRYEGGGGWDECAPTVGDCVIDDSTVLVDHGDAWRKPWTVETSTPRRIKMNVMLDTVGVTLTRTIRPTRDGVRLGYRAHTRSTEAVPLLWCAHPLFKASEGEQLVVRGPFIEHFPAFGNILSDLPNMDQISVGTAIKAFGLSKLDRAEIKHPAGFALQIRWSGWPIGETGIYVDNGVFSGRPILGIEPSTGRHDLASEVWAELPVVTARRPLRWAIEVRLNHEAGRSRV